jgi:hypothetical protein
MAEYQHLIKDLTEKRLDMVIKYGVALSEVSCYFLLLYLDVSSFADESIRQSRVQLRQSYFRGVPFVQPDLRDAGTDLSAK